MEKKHPKAALQYALDVTEGRILTGRLTRLACQRFLNDLKRDDIWFDEVAANRECNFIERLPHVKGKWAAKKETIKLEPWQSFAECNLYGWKWKRNNLRRFRESYEEVARKNAKSTRLAGRALYMFCEDGEFGAEVYSGATSEKQAYEVFRPAHQMVKRTPKLQRHYDIEAPVKSLYIVSNGSRFEPLIGKPGDGASPSFAVVDEYHEHPSDDLYETMLTGMGAREQPLISAITTAGSNLSGPCYEKRLDAIKVLEGTVVDDSLFVLIYTIDEDDQWDDPECLVKANPNLDVSVSRDFLLTQLDKARRSASLQNAFRTKHLNQWVGSKVAWMNMLAWQRQKMPCVLQDFSGKRAWLSVDLNSKIDLAAIGILIPDGNKFRVFAEFFVPETAAENNDTYRMYREHLTVTPGNATDYGFIEERLKQLAAILDVQEVAFDQWQAQYLAQRMISQGMNMVEFPHQVRTMSDPMKELEALVLDGRLTHDGNPILTWNMANTVCKSDAKENIYPTKERPHDDKCKIDGVVALIMAMGRYLATEDQGGFDDFLANPVRFG
jgi:phage terminase large subunit-like protein